jgi:hypothetical protein
MLCYYCGGKSRSAQAVSHAFRLLIDCYSHRVDGLS